MYEDDFHDEDIDFDPEPLYLDEEADESEVSASEDEPLTAVPSVLSADAEDESAEEVHDDRQWYVVHCYSGQENKVRYAIEQRIETMANGAPSSGASFRAISWCRCSWTRIPGTWCATRLA